MLSPILTCILGEFSSPLTVTSNFWFAIDSGLGIVWRYDCKAFAALAFVFGSPASSGFDVTFSLSNVKVTPLEVGTILPSAIKADVASYIVFALAISALTLAFLCIDKKFGIAIAANIAMIAITIISSIRVKPYIFLVCFFVFISYPP